MLSRLTLLTAASGLVLLSACEDVSPGQGALAGAAFGYITAQALEADEDWTILTVLAGAAIGTLVARDYKTNRCAYVRAYGRYYIQPCPRPYRR